MHTTEIPMHDELDSGTLNGILNRVAQRNNVDKSVLMGRLRTFK
jgi:hypothetical protein